MKTRLSIAVALISALLGACSTRVGNPPNPKPKPQVAVMPTIVASTLQNVSAFPAAGLALVGEGSGATAGTSSWPTAVMRFTTALASQNDLAAAFNALAVPVGEDFFASPNGVEVSARVDTISDSSIFSHRGVLCQDGAVFAQFSWSDDTGAVALVRRTDLDPLIANDSAAALGDAMFEFQYTSNPATTSLTGSISGELKQSDPLVPAANTVRDYGYINEDKASTRLNFSFVTDYSPSELGVGEVHIVGDLVEETSTLIANHRGIPVICQPFDEKDTDQPGWCVGLAVNGSKGSFLPKADVDLAWDRLRTDTPFASVDSLKSLTFDSSRQCPKR